MNWDAIAKQYFPPSVSSNACRKRHERVMEKRNAEDWDDFRLERLAIEYTKSKKEMWSLLAVPLGERWQNVEAKVSSAHTKQVVC